VPYALGVPWQAIPFSAGQRPLLALELAADAWQQIKWRDGSNTPLSSRFASWRVRPARDDAKRGEPAPEEWLLIEWPEGAAEPDHYWLSTGRRFRSRRHRRIIGCCTGRGIGGRQRRIMRLLRPFASTHLTPLSIDAYRLKLEAVIGIVGSTNHRFRLLTVFRRV
jgi:hypothetical protein